VECDQDATTGERD